MKDIYPLVIVSDRYSGVYSGAKFIAWHCHIDQVPVEQEGNDSECRAFWDDDVEKPMHGKGDTINAAIEDLINKLNKFPEERFYMCGL